MSDSPEKSPEEIAEEARRKLDQVDAEFEDRLSQLEMRAEKAKTKFDNAKTRLEEQRASDSESARGLGIGLTVAYAIIGMPLFGLGVGWALEKFAGVKGIQGGLIVLGAFVGVGYAIWILNKTQDKP